MSRRAVCIAANICCCLYFSFVYRANAQQPKLFVGMILILIFAEALALYGLIGTSLHLPAMSLKVKHCNSTALSLQIAASGTYILARPDPYDKCHTFPIMQAVLCPS